MTILEKENFFGQSHDLIVLRSLDKFYLPLEHISSIDKETVHDLLNAATCQYVKHCMICWKLLIDNEMRNLLETLVVKLWKPWQRLKNKKNDTKSMQMNSLRGYWHFWYGVVEWIKKRSRMMKRNKRKRKGTVKKQFRHAKDLIFWLTEDFI